MTLNIILDQITTKEKRFREVIKNKELATIYIDATSKTARQMKNEYKIGYSDVWSYAEKHAFKCVKKYIKRQ